MRNVISSDLGIYKLHTMSANWKLCTFNSLLSKHYYRVSNRSKKKMLRRYSNSFSALVDLCGTYLVQKGENVNK